MKIRIGFLHEKDEIIVSFSGKFSIKDMEGNSIGSTDSGVKYVLSAAGSVPAEYQWYEKIQTVSDITKLESNRDKYKTDGRSTRIIKTGKKIGNTDNFEYWLLKTASDMDGRIYPSGDYRFKKVIKKEAAGEIGFNGKEYSGRIIFVPESPDCSFTVYGVRVGIDFHWDHTEDLEYGGALEVMIGNSGKLTAVNIVEMEEYIASVNSSEMRNDNNIEMLKAQTVAARSTVLATMGKHHFSDGFDLCADDHCQCYQGRKKLSELSVKVAKETSGEVLVFDSKVVDARYSKICGGITERYSACWEDMDYPYLASVIDSGGGQEIFSEMTEKETEDFISDKRYSCFCNTYKNNLPESLSFCKDLFRWERYISAAGISENLAGKFKTDVGEVLELKVLRRGRSGRVISLEVVGTGSRCIIEKELNVRKLLSDTHLPSSAIVIKHAADGYRISGAGWGHGVGLCQIGAQIMGESGFGYAEILKHYYRGSVLKDIGEL